MTPRRIHTPDEHQEALAYITEPDFERYAQMSVETAFMLGYIDSPFYRIIHPWGHESSAYLPYIIEPKLRRCAKYKRFFFTYASFNGTQELTCGKQMQVLVYRHWLLTL